MKRIVNVLIFGFIVVVQSHAGWNGGGTSKIERMYIPDGIKYTQTTQESGRISLTVYDRNEQQIGTFSQSNNVDILGIYKNTKEVK